jgi:protein-disulfide isomerase
MGLSIPIIGITFFAATGIIYEIGRSRELFSVLFRLSISGAAGAEVAFILIQKFRIQKWCPLCLGIAATVYLTAVIISLGSMRNLIPKVKDRRITFMSVARKLVVVVMVFLAGYFLAYSGMRSGEAEEKTPNIFLGKQDSPVEVFIMTDWFCPACRKAEQEIEKVLPDLGGKAKIIFVDVAIHPETLNYSPYNLSFLTYDKDKYMELRKALIELAKKTKNPGIEEVQQAIRPLNVTYKPLSFLDATKGIRYFDSLAREFKVNATPTVVIRNAKTNKMTKFVGFRDVTEANIRKAIEEIVH